MRAAVGKLVLQLNLDPVLCAPLPSLRLTKDMLQNSSIGGKRRH